MRAAPNNKPTASSLLPHFSLVPSSAPRAGLALLSSVVPLFWLPRCPPGPRQQLVGLSANLPSGGMELKPGMSALVTGGASGIGQRLPFYPPPRRESISQNGASRPDVLFACTSAKGSRCAVCLYLCKGEDPYDLGDAIPSN
jgi:hypothetical protein